MSTRIPALLTTGLCLVAIGGGAGTAAARQGADDPAGHVRHSQGADDDTQTAAERRAQRHRSRHRHGASHHRRSDDRAGRRGGHDDGANHT